MPDGEDIARHHADHDTGSPVPDGGDLSDARAASARRARRSARLGRAPGRHAVGAVDVRPDAGRSLRGEPLAAADLGRSLPHASPASDGDADIRKVTHGTEALLRHFRTAFAADPAAAYRDWFRTQEELRDSGDAASARALADDLWELLPGFVFDAPATRARFLHNAAVFFGSPGPAGNLDRARDAFSRALAVFSQTGDPAWEARARHNFATSLSNLGTTPADLDESIALFELALAWRTAEREIARGVTLHNLGLARRRLSELDPSRRQEALERSAAALAEAEEIRARHGLEEGRARSLFHRGISLLRLSEERGRETAPEACDCLQRAASEFDRLGKPDSAATARELASACALADD